MLRSIIVDTKEKLHALPVEPMMSVDLETTSKDPMVAEIVGVAISFNTEEGYYVPIAHKSATNVRLADCIDYVKHLFADPRCNIIGQNFKYDLKILMRHGVDRANVIFDTMIAEYVINPENTKNMDDMAMRYLEHKTIKFNDVVPKGGSFADVDVEKAAQYAVEDVCITMAIAEKQAPLLNEETFKIEMELLKVLTMMEYVGVKIDEPYLATLGKKWGKEGVFLLYDIFKAAGRHFNVNSPKQLKEVLFCDLELPRQGKTKSGNWSTDTTTLQKIAHLHPLPQLLLRYRKLAKMLNTYIEPLPDKVLGSTGRIHANFNQTVTVTNRLSSSEPNLQNIPSRGDEGAALRKAFVAEDGNVLVGADYSQIELRVFAHFSQDATLVAAYKDGEDIHSVTASRIFDVPTPSSEQRSRAKTINFGILYGMYYKRLANELKIEEQEAKDMLDAFFGAFPGVVTFIKSVKQEAKAKGFAETMYGHRRYLPGLASENKYEVMQAERHAVSQVVQGSAADIIKVAMCNLFHTLPQDAIMVLQVHDEIIVECPETMAAEVSEVLSSTMENAVKLDVPLVAEASIGKNWGEIK